MKFVERVCERCQKPKGTLAYRYRENGETKRGYFHPVCFRKRVVELRDE